LSSWASTCAYGELHTSFRIIICIRLADPCFRTPRPYPETAQNILKLFADVQVVVVVLIGLVLRIDEDDFADEAVSRNFYGNVMVAVS
jgi:hypothetical protein